MMYILQHGIQQCEVAVHLTLHKVSKWISHCLDFGLFEVIEGKLFAITDS